MIEQSSPVIAVRDIVAFPNTIVPLYVGRRQSVNAINHAFKEGQSVVIVTQKKAHIEDVTTDNLYMYGVLANIVHVARTGKMEMKVIVDIHSRVKITGFLQNDESSILNAKYIKEKTNEISKEEAELLVRALKNTFAEYVKASSVIPVDIVATVSQIEDPDVYVDIISSTMPVKIQQKMEVLQELDFAKRVTKISQIYNSEIKLAHLENKIQGKVRQNLTKNQQEHYLREQIDVLQKELNAVNGKDEDSADKYEKLLKKLKAPKEVKERVQEEITRLKSLSSYSSETSIVKTYLDWIFALPWGTYSKTKIDAKKAEDILNRDHYGLEKIKERILEYIAVYSRIEKPKGQILCLYGPPGVGKTSIVASIAEAMGKNISWWNERRS
ncbi:MAG: LON peptidase substrate-binding domain-containing protein [Proteobacteria bacterium]|nr:LON peptidase substrate-binding domain-containing protein [Pseudomonadota bacterium]